MHTMKWAVALLATVVLAGLGTGLGLWTQQILQAETPAARVATATGAGQPQQPAGQPKVATAQKTDEQRFVGTWRITKGRQDGKDMPEEFLMLARLTFTKDGKMSMTLLEDSREYKYKLTAPGQLDFAMGTGDDLSPSIYKFEGNDRLTICCFNDAPAGSKRPTEFSGEQGTGQVLLVLERVQPGKEKLTPEEIAKYKEAIDKVRAAAAHAQTANNLKQIGLAMHNYHSVYKALPLHAIYSQDGTKPLLSWRVAILPFIEQQPLYQEFKLDEPWDSPHNKKLIAKMPPIYAPVGPPNAKPGLTPYQVFTGPDTLFNRTTKMTLEDIGDGTSNTLLVIEAKEPVIWTKPDDLPLPKDKKDKMPAVGGMFKNGMLVLFCDGSVQFLRRDLAPDVLRALVTPNGKEEIDLEKLQADR
jgi:uncharacterized protein (TIGR03067 family)